MAKLVFLPLLVLCCVLFVSCRAALVSADPPANPKEFIENQCRWRTGVLEDLCFKDLSPFASEIKGDQKRLAIKAVSITKDKVKSSVKLLRKLRHDKNTSHDEEEVVDYCILKFTEDAELIAWTEESLKSIGQDDSDDTSFIIGSVNSWLRDSENNGTGCVQSISKLQDRNLVDAYHNLEEAVDTIQYTWELVGVYFETLTSHAQPPSAGASPPSDDFSDSPDPWGDFTEAKCKAATGAGADQCNNDIVYYMGNIGSSYGLKRDDQTIGLVALNASRWYVDSLVSYMNQTISDKNRTSQDKQVAQMCTDKLGKASEKLSSSYKNVQEIGSGNNSDDDSASSSIKSVQGWLQEAIESEKDCADSATNLEGDVNGGSVKDELNKTMQSTKNALALVNSYFQSPKSDALSPSASKSNVPSHSASKSDAPSPSSSKRHASSHSASKSDAPSPSSSKRHASSHSASKSDAPSPASSKSSSSAGSDPASKYADSPDPWEDFIEDTCKKATKSHADQCIHDITHSMGRPGLKMDEHTISLLAVNASVKHADSLVSFMNQIVSDNNKTEKEKQAAQTCAGELNKALATLTGSYNSLQKIDLDSTTGDALASSIESVKGFLEDVVDSEKVCSNLADKFEVKDDSVQDKLDGAMQSAKIALALAKDYFKSKLSEGSAPSPSA